MARRKKPILERHQALRIAFKRGLLSYQLRDYQKDLYDKVYNSFKRKELRTVIKCTRRYGKSHVLALICDELCRANPGWNIVFVTTTGKALRSIIRPIMNTIHKDCPEHLKPKWNGQDGCYTYSNGSVFRLHGTDAQNHDGLRGGAINLGIVDEAAYCQDLDYIVRDILQPQTLTCNGRVVISSTPSKKMNKSAEEFRNFFSDAEYYGASYIRTIYDTDYDDEKIEQYKKDSGGAASVTWKTEYLCEFMVDPEKRLVPEWNSAYITDTPQDQYFSYYHKYVCMDLGVKRDYTCMLFGYYNFMEAKLVILDEHIMKNMTSLELVNVMKAKEASHFQNLPIYRRVADSDNPLLLNDMGTLHGLPIMPTNKTTLETMVNHMRTFVGAGKLSVHSRCTYLVGCLEHGVWADDAMGRERRNFGRTAAYGHFDGIAAIMYLIRNLDTTTNPIPTLLSVDPNNSHISQGYGDNKQNNGFKKMFKKFK